MNYQIITAPSIDALPSAVNRALMNGWEFHGSPFALHTVGYYGQAVIRKQKTLNDFLPKKDASPKQVEQPAFNADEMRLFNALKEKRLTLAAEMTGPAYCIATNKMLYELVSKKPKTLDELASVSGFGPAKVKLCGEEFLKIIGEHSA